MVPSKCGITFKHLLDSKYIAKCLSNKISLPQVLFQCKLLVSEVFWIWRDKIFLMKSNLKIYWNELLEKWRIHLHLFWHFAINPHHDRYHCMNITCFRSTSFIASEGDNTGRKQPQHVSSAVTADPAAEVADGDRPTRKLLILVAEGGMSGLFQKDLSAIREEGQYRGPIHRCRATLWPHSRQLTWTLQRKSRGRAVLLATGLTVSLMASLVNGKLSSSLFFLMFVNFFVLCNFPFRLQRRKTSECILFLVEYSALVRNFRLLDNYIQVLTEFSIKKFH